MITSKRRHSSAMYQRVEKDMKEFCDKKREAIQEEQEALFKERHSRSFSMRLLDYNRPRISLVLGIFGAIAQGCMFPVFAIFVVKLIFVLNNAPLNEVLAKMGYPHEDTRKDANHWCLIMAVVAIVNFFSTFLHKFSFGVIGENVALNIRKGLYSSILKKDVAWFDDKNNSPGVLTSTLASDAQIINGASAEGLATQLEGGSALFVSVAISFFYSWRMSLVCLGLTPFLVLGSVYMSKF